MTNNPAPVRKADAPMKARARAPAQSMRRVGCSASTSATLVTSSSSIAEMPFSRHRSGGREAGFEGSRSRQGLEQHRIEHWSAWSSHLCSRESCWPPWLRIATLVAVFLLRREPCVLPRLVIRILIRIKLRLMRIKSSDIFDTVGKAA
jgi:hypothetical protein